MTQQIAPNMLDLGGGGFDARNLIINGNCRVAQRGTGTLSVNTLTYGGCDRIYFYNSGFAGGLSGSLDQVFGLANTNSPRSGFAQRATVTASTGSSSVIQFGTRLESKDVWRLIGKTVTVSMALYQTTGASVPVVIGLKRPSATDNFTTTTSIASSNAGSVPDTTWTTVSASFTLSYGDVQNGLEVYVYFSGLVSFTSKQFSIGDFQMTEGTTVLPIDVPPYQADLAACQRYYYRLFPAATNKPLGSGFASTTTQAAIETRFPVTMRVAPTALEQSGVAGQYAVAYLATSTVCSAVPTFAQASQDSALSVATIAAGLTAGNGLQFRTDTTSGASAYLGWTAEL